MKKSIFLIEPRGFCFGVENALNIVSNVLLEHSGKRVFIYNEIVHNKTIVEELKSKGVSFTQDEKEIPLESVVIFSAHGVSPQIREYFKTKNVLVVDATCPLVNKVHREVIEYTQKGYHIVYIGSPKHDESKAVIAEAPHNITVIEKEEDIFKIPRDQERYMILNQTTLNIYEVKDLFEQIKKYYKNVFFPKKQDICFATSARQKAIKDEAEKCDLIIVLGSQNSSNSQKLKDIAEDSGVKAVLVDSYQEIPLALLEEANNIGITAGASAPEKLVEETVLFIQKKFNG